MSRCSTRRRQTDTDLEVRTGSLGKLDEDRLKNGTKSAKGAAFVCIRTGAAIARDYIQAEGKADRLGQRLMAIVADGSRTRVYLSPDRAHEDVAIRAEDAPIVSEARETFLSSPTPTRAMITGGVCSAYGLRTWGHLFTPRQLIALTTFSDLVTEARQRVLADACAAGLADDPTSLHNDGVGAVSYADAISTYLAFAVDKAGDRSTTLCAWESKMDRMRNTFGRQALPMVWDYVETNPLGGAGGDIAGTAHAVFEVLNKLDNCGKSSIAQTDATKNSFSIRPIIVSTDPPYYDNIGYGDLSDFFYVWLRRSLQDIWPDLFRRLTTPKSEELVATHFRFPDGKVPDWVVPIPELAARWPSMSPKDRAETFFMRGMGAALVAIRKASVEEVPLTIYYAFKQAEATDDGITSAGWASFLQAVVDAGLGIDGTWPMRTELSNRMISSGTNALASSIVLVCRTRPAEAPAATRPDFIRHLKRELPDAIENIRKAGVGPVDMQQSIIGPGMGVFTRFARVLEDDDSIMPVKTALSLINRVWEEIENELDSAFDAETQVALAWFATYGFDAKPSGELITLANAKNVPLSAMFETGVFQDLRGRTALMPRGDLPRDWSPATDIGFTVWECVQHTARVLNAEDGGGVPAATLIGQMGAKSSEARALAYRLFEIATQKGWAAEALVYNELAQEWPHLEELALTASGGPARITQGDMFAEAR